MKTGLFPSVLMSQLDKLGHLFVWRRKALRDSIVEALKKADCYHEIVSADLQNIKMSLDLLTVENSQLAEHQANTMRELSDTRQSLQYVQTILEQEREQHLRYQEMARAHFDDLSMQHQQLGNEFQSLHKRHGDTWTRFELISRLLAAHAPENMGLARFRDLLTNDYMKFAESESSLAAEAKALMMLQSIEQELSLLVSFCDIRERTIVGIVGGFSSGKSEFINSFIRDPKVRLAVGMQPVTVIPSYVLATDDRSIRGYSVNGGYIDLEVDFYKNISHAFINSFSFDLKSLMPFMCVGVQMNPEYFKNICFIDTPGYNPPATAAEHSQGDKHTAIQFAQQSDVIIWLIGLDANGTVPDSDLEFIQQIGVEQRSVYVVLTKADLKSEDDIEQIMDEVQDILRVEGLSIVGISAYSAILRNEIAYRRVSLLEYFTKINVPGDAQKHLEGRLGEVFSMYENAIQLDLHDLCTQKTSINGLRLDALEVGGQKVYERLLGSIDRLDRKLDEAHLEQSLKESRCLFDEFIEAINLTTNEREA